MRLSPETRRTLTTTAPPVVALAALGASWGRDVGTPVAVLLAFVLAGATFSAVHHAEVVAQRVGEPFGSLILAVAVTVIEVGLIVSLMASGGQGTETLARDTVFAAVMITTNGIVGLSLLVGAVRFGLARFNAEGAGAALATVATLAALTLVLPAFTTSAPGPRFSPAQLAFASVASVALYAMFVLTQTVRNREFFLPLAADGEADDGRTDVTTRAALVSLGLLVVALVGVVGLAKVESKPVEHAVHAVGLPQSFVGVIIAMLVLLPETVAAIHAARRDRIQTSLNLGYGSAMASIGLTIPTLAVTRIWLDGPLTLGLTSTQLVLLGMTVVAGALTVVPGRATRLQGGVHLTILAAFVFLAINP